MVLDIELFRAEKGGDPEKMRENQRKRFKDVKLVDLIVEKDLQWRQRKYIFMAYHSDFDNDVCSCVFQFVSN